MYKHLIKITGSRWLFAGLIGLFAAQAIFVAVNSQFPMPFDEGYHFSLIKYYSETLSPIISTQPTELNAVGDATRLTSYLSHYILSFPLRLVSQLGGDIGAQVMTLRLINIGFVVGALSIFRLLLVRLTKSGAISNMAILLYCLLPVTSFLAAHINYDNLLLLCFASLLLIAQKILVTVNKGERVTANQTLLLVSIGALSCLVKFTFLPIAAVIVIFVFVITVRKRAWPVVGLKKDAKLNYGLFGMILLSAASIGLFVERYATNVAEYGSLQPDCAAVQPIKTCLQNGPWARNYNLLQAAPNDVSFEGRSLQGYVINLWAPVMTKSLGIVGSGEKIVNPPTTVVNFLKVLFGLTAIGLLIGLVAYRKNTMVVMLVLAATVYFLALLQRNYSEFMQLHELVAVQGRYALPFLIPLFAIGIKALLEVRKLRHAAQISFASVAVGLMIINPYVVYAIGTKTSSEYSFVRTHL